MTTSNVSQIIQDLAIDNFSIYPGNYTLTKEGLATDEAMENIADLGKSYFEARTEDEIKRDSKLNINVADYVGYCMDAFSRFLNIKEC